MKLINVLIPALFLLFTGCRDLLDTGTDRKDTTKNMQFTAVVWNVQALFDGTEDGIEYDEYRTSAGWTREKYEARLLSLAQAVLQARPLGENLLRDAQNLPEAASAKAAKPASDSVPDLIGLVELENAKILEDLIEGPLAKQGYNHTFFGNSPGMSLGIGVLSRYPLTETKIHSITMGGETIPRPVLEVQLEPGGNTIVFFVCHWKSKVGGDAATESLRRASARVIRRRIIELKTEKPGAPVIVMGDLNENHDEYYRFQGSYLSALVPDDPHAALLVKSTQTFGDYLILSSQKPPRAEHFDPLLPVLYTPWGNEMSDGSYHYRGAWETIDHFLLSEELFDNTGWEYNSALVINLPPFINSRGQPAAYTPRNGQGLSDHLPLMLFLLFH